MLRLLGPGVRLCDGWNRREVLRIGGLGLLGAGLNLTDLLRATAIASGPVTNTSSFGRAKSCIVLFLMGGPSQHSTWDPKPDAPAEVTWRIRPDRDDGCRAYRYPSCCRVTALVADKLCILRAVSTGDNAHSSSGYYMLTGRPHQPMNFENANPGAPNDAPSLGAVLRRIRTTHGGLPDSVTLPHRIFNTDGSIWPGQDAGFLGRTSDPWLLECRLGAHGYRIQEIDLPADIDHSRLGRRKDLLSRIERDLDTFDRRRAPQERLTSRHARRSISSARLRLVGRSAWRKSPRRTEIGYGRTPFGQSVLAGPPAGRGRSPAGSGQLVSRSRRTAGQPLLGQPRRRIGPAQGRSRTADRSGLLGIARGSGSSRAAGGDACRVHGGVRSHASTRRQRRSGSLGLGLLSHDGWRRNPRWPGLWRVGSNRSLSRRGAREARRSVRDDLSLPGLFSEHGISRPARQTSPDQPGRGSARDLVARGAAGRSLI